MLPAAEPRTAAGPLTADPIEAAADLFRALSDRTRLRLLLLLRDGERCVGDLCAALAAQQPTVSHHLGLLRSAGPVATRRAGKQVFYRLAAGVAAGGGGGLSVRADGLSVLVSI